MPNVVAERLVVEVNWHERLAPAVSHRSTLVVGGQIPEVTLKILGAHRSLAVTGEDGLDAEIGHEYEAPVGTAILDHVLADDVAAERHVGLSAHG
jgi:hypothetical protein